MLACADKIFVDDSSGKTEDVLPGNVDGCCRGLNVNQGSNSSIE